VIDNRPGAGTIVGAGFVAKAAPDGYAAGQLGHHVHGEPGHSAKLPYDPVKSFEPIGLRAARA
jgi:tripartite-type tricarboxylate transporter receptor subunit TctC